MKRCILFFCTALAMGCIGCQTTGHMAARGFIQSAWVGDTKRPDPVTPGGITLPIASTVSLGIDIAGIVDYLQGEPVLSPHPYRPAPPGPLIQWIQQF